MPAEDRSKLAAICGIHDMKTLPRVSTRRRSGAAALLPDVLDGVQPEEFPRVESRQLR
jgi:hypothetical protein